MLGIYCSYLKQRLFIIFIMCICAPYALAGRNICKHCEQPLTKGCGCNPFYLMADMDQSSINEASPSGSPTAPKDQTMASITVEGNDTSSTASENASDSVSPLIQWYERICVTDAQPSLQAVRRKDKAPLQANWLSMIQRWASAKVTDNQGGVYLDGVTQFLIKEQKYTATKITYQPARGFIQFISNCLSDPHMKFLLSIFADDGDYYYLFETYTCFAHPDKQRLVVALFSDDARSDRMARYLTPKKVRSLPRVLNRIRALHSNSLLCNNFLSNNFLSNNFLSNNFLSNNFLSNNYGVPTDPAPESIKCYAFDKKEKQTRPPSTDVID